MISQNNDGTGDVHTGNLPKNPYTPDPWPYVVKYQDQQVALALCPALPDGRDPILSYLVFKIPDLLHAVDQGCIYHRDPTSAPADCIYSSVTNVLGPKENSGSIAREVKRSAWADSDRKDPVKCGDKVAQFMSLKLDQMGRFRISSVTSWVSCKKYDYAGGQASQIRDCAPRAHSRPAKVSKVQVWCNDWDQTWDPGSPAHTFTMDECTGMVTPPWKCVKATVSGPPSVLDDGKARKYTWTSTDVVDEVPGAERVKNVLIDQSQVTVHAGSTPSRDGAAQDAPNQKYLAPSADPVSEQKVLHLQFFAPGMPGRPWMLDRVVSYSADFSTPHVTIKKMNMETGKVEEFAPTFTWKHGTGTCASESLTVDVKRAHNVR